MTKKTASDFDLADFLPFLLNQAAERAAQGFQEIYQSEYNMMRAEWRILFHLGRYGDMTATEIGRRANTHKTKISRAVRALEDKGLLTRTSSDSDRRTEYLSLTAAGKAAYAGLAMHAEDYDRALSESFTPEEARLLRDYLRRLAR